MKRLLSLFILIHFGHLAFCQDLWIYSIKGEIEIKSSDSWKPAEIYQKLFPSDSIKFGAKSSISILDRNNEKLYSIQDDGTKTVDNLVKEATLHSVRQSKGIISYLWDSLTGKNNEAEYRQSAGVVYRNDDIVYALASAIMNSNTTLPVDFILIDKQTGDPVGGMAEVGNSAIFKVHNNSSLDLFVNFIDVDSIGNVAPCIPVNSAQTMVQLLIPANSEILLDSFPIVFAEPRGKDDIILVASPRWFDIDAVVDACLNGKETSTKVDVGTFKQRLIIK